MTLDGRWTVFVCSGCGEATGRHQDCDAKREATPVVPCDFAAIERVAGRIRWECINKGVRLHEAFIQALAFAALEAAGEVPRVQEGP